MDSIMSSEKDWMEDIYRQRKQGVGSLALDWLMNSLKDALHGAKTYLDQTHPSHGGYTGKNWLARMADEYRKRFGIDLGSGPVKFDRLQELVLARNAGIHRSREILDEYLAKVEKPAFVDDEERFFVTSEALVQISKECEQFIEWVVKEIEKLGPARKRTTKA
jgi:histidinol phosphatase-like enzyme